MKMIIYLIIFVVLFVIYVRFLESKSIFFPTREIASTPQHLDLPFEDVYIKTEDNVTLNGWFIKGPQSSPQSTLLFLHGNGGNIADRMGKIYLFHHMGLNIFILDYRGYGKSEGHPTEEGLYKDALAAYDYLQTRKDINTQEIVGYGASLGGSVVIDLATKRKLSSLIIDSSFSSAADIAKTIYPFIPSFLLRTKLDSVSKIKNITIPKLFIHSIEDEMIPIKLGEKLYEAAPEPKEFLKIIGGHNDSHVLDQEKITNGIIAFLKNSDQI